MPSNHVEVDDRLQAILELYLEEFESQGRVDRERFLERHAELADQLRPHLDGIDLMLQMRQPASSDSMPAVAAGDSVLRPLATLGDFRLIKEIGRGGMGVVFEAQQFRGEPSGVSWTTVPIKGCSGAILTSTIPLGAEDLPNSVTATGTKQRSLALGQATETST